MTKGRTFNWIQNFSFDRYIQVKLGTAFLNGQKVDNPLGYVISPQLFSIMINDAFSVGNYDREIINRSGWGIDCGKGGGI